MPLHLEWIRFERLRKLLPWLAAIWFFAATCNAAEVPPLEGRVNDHAGILSTATKASFEQKLAAYERSTGHQLAILTIRTLAGDPIEDYGIRVVEAWKLGKKGKDDGILMMVASDDRKMRIEVGYGLEGELPDAAAGRIVRDVMAPHFRRGDFEGGMNAGMNAIFSATGAEALSSQQVPTRNGWDAGTAQGRSAHPAGIPKAPPAGILGWAGYLLSMLFRIAFFGIFVLILLFLVVANLFGGGSRRSRGIYFGGFGGGGFGSGGGGFGGGGGGSFGGGGASGDW